MYDYTLDMGIRIYTPKNRPGAERAVSIRHQGRPGANTGTVMEHIFSAENSGGPERNLRLIEGFRARLEVMA